MNNLQKPILGEVSALTITTHDLEMSLAFYRKLGFAELMRADFPFPWIQISDGVLLIMLRQDEQPYLALTYYVKNVEKVAKELEQKQISFIHKPKPKDMVKRYLFQSPDGLNISLVGGVEGFRQPPGPGMPDMPQADFFNPDKYVNKVCGLFGELAHPVADLEKSIQFWKMIGFTPVSIYTDPYPWAILTDGLGIVGLHQSNHFNYPAITYFAADRVAKVKKLKQERLTGFLDESFSNAKLKTPEGQHFFLFSLGMETEPVKKQLKDIPRTIIETPRLLLKELTPEILHELFTEFGDGEIMEFLGLRTLEELETERNKFKKGYTTYRLSQKRFQIEEKATGGIVGSCDFHNYYFLHNRAELGYGLTTEEAKQKGFITEAVKAIIKYGFEQMGLNRIEAFAGKWNIPSLKILKGAGFKEEGVLRSHFLKNGVYEDSVCFSLLRDEYVAKG